MEVEPCMYFVLGRKNHYQKPREHLGGGVEKVKRGNNGLWSVLGLNSIGSWSPCKIFSRSGTQLLCWEYTMEGSGWKHRNHLEDSGCEMMVVLTWREQGWWWKAAKPWWILKVKPTGILWDTCEKWDKEKIQG